MVDLVMVFFTVNRIRQLGVVAGVSCILAGLLLLMLSPIDWRSQHPYTYAYFFTLFAAGILTIWFTRVRDATSVVEDARIAGYEASEEEKRREEHCLREMGTLYLLVPIAYTTVWLLVTYFLVEPSGMLAVKIISSAYVAFTWGWALFLIILFAIPIFNDRGYQDLNALIHKSLEGARARRRMRKLGEKNAGDLRILDEDESKKGKEN
jgi:MFS family permease